MFYFKEALYKLVCGIAKLLPSYPSGSEVIIEKKSFLNVSSAMHKWLIGG